MIGAFTKAIGQLSDPPIKAVIWKSIAGTIAVFSLLVIGIGWVLANTAFFDIGWLETTIDIFGGLAGFILALVLFPGVVSGLASFLLEDVAEAVEGRHYPDLGPPRPMGWGTLISTSLRLIGLTIVLNLMALPFYLIPGVNIAVFYGLNGHLLGREYFEVVALRRLDSQAAKSLRQNNKGKVWVAGAITAFLLTVPVVNMIAPVLGTAAMVHLFYKINKAQS